MAVGKNKKLGKKKKSAGKKATDPFAKKEWYDVKAPSVFQIRNLGHTVVSKTAGQKNCSGQSGGPRVRIQPGRLEGERRG